MEHLQAYNKKLLSNILPVHVADHFLSVDKNNDVSFIPDLRSFLHKMSWWGSGCSTAVEHTPRDREVVAFFSSLPYPMKCLRNQVPRGGATLLIFLFKNIHA